MAYLLTYKLSQDHIELFFSAVRSKGGCNNNPTARQFEAIYKGLLLHFSIKGSKHANVMSLDNISILGCTYVNTLTKSNCGELMEENDDYLKYTNETKNIIQSTIQSWKLTPYVCDIVAYISGFVVKTLKKCVVCLECVKIMECDEVISLLQQRKQYGNLTKASRFVINLCQEAEWCVRVVKNSRNILSHKIGINHFIVTSTIKNLDRCIYNVFEQHQLDDDLWSNHSTLLVKLILRKYVTLRLHHESNLVSEVSKRIRSNLTKTILFKNQ